MAGETTGTEVTTGTESTGTETTGTETTTTGTPDTTTKAPEGTTGTATTETAAKPEFADENMQRAWTEKTTKLAEERKAFEESRSHFEGSKSSLEQKAALFDKFDSDPVLANIIRKHYGVETEKTSISQEELAEAQINPDKMRELIEREAKKSITPVTARMEQRMGALELENAIQAYSESKGNEDFWDLYDAGLIKDKMTAMRHSDPRKNDLDVLKEAHLEARRIINSINERAEKLAREKAAGVVQEKKSAIMDKGGRSATTTAGKSYKGKSITEVANEILGGK